MITAPLRNYLCCFLTLCLLACSPTKGQPQLSTAQVQSDLRQLQSELERYHAGYDWYTSRDSLDFYFNQAIQDAERMNRQDFYQVVTGLVANVHCGHTQVSSPSDLRQSFESKAAFLPLSVNLVGREVWVFGVPENEDRIQPGDQLLFINDQPVSSIIEKIYGHLSGDGMNTTFKARRTEMRFSHYYNQFVEPETSIYELTLLRNGRQIEVTVDGAALDEVPPPSFKRNAGGLLKLEDRGNYYSMRISTFGSSLINRAGADYYDFLSASFAEINTAPKPIVLDLRGNGGGDDLYGAKLVSYLVDQPFRYFDKIEVTEHYSGYGNVEEADGTKLMTSHDGLNVQQPSANSFGGSLYVLVDGLSFSTCADVASVLKANNRGVLIGEETGGGSGGNTSGYSRSLTLDHSGISINIPMWKYTTAPDPNRLFGRGVMPDVEVSLQTSNLHQHGDATMEKALELVNGN